MASPTDTCWGVYLISPDLKMGQTGLAIDGRKRTVHRVRAMGDFHAANARDVETRIERKFFLHHQHPAFEPRLEHEQYRGVGTGV